MKIRRISQITGEENEMDLNITQEQIDAYEGGALIQEAFPDLSNEEREFFKTGITPQEWQEQIADNPEDYDETGD
jgi:hypothetical protein